MSILSKIKHSLHAFLTSGLSPEKMALTVALGFTLGIMPMPWGTTLCCAAAAFLFRLNQAGIQFVNYLVYPLQLALLIPFFRFGERLFPSAPRLTAAVGTGVGLHAGLFSLVGMSALKALTAWLVVAPFVALLLYGVAVVLFRRRPALRRPASTAL